MYTGVYTGVYMAEDSKTDLKQPEPSKAGIQVSQAGVLVAESHDELWRICNLWLKSGLCPESFKRPEQVFFAQQTLASLGVNPLSWLKNCAFIKNSFAIFGDLPLALVNMSGKLLGQPNEFLIDKNYSRICRDNKNLHEEAYAAVCQMTPAEGNGAMQERVFTLDDAKTAGKIPARAPSPWAMYPKRMLALKARGWLIKDLFPEVLNGVAQAEYDFDALPDAKVTHIKEAPAHSLDLNAQYGAEDN